MSALRQPDFAQEYYSPPTQSPNKLVQKKARKPQVKRNQVLRSRSFTQANKLPKNLKLLTYVQTVSFGLALTSMTASIGLYISSVQIPKIWSQEYQNLEELQRQERQLVSINETIKYQIAKEAGANNKLAISQPESALFIDPAQVEPRAESAIASEAKIVNLKYSSWGY